MKARLALDEATLAGFCDRHSIRRLSLFGSQLKGTARPDSDLDPLVEFELGKEPCLIALTGIALELSALLGASGGSAHGAGSIALLLRRGCAHG